MSRWTVAGHPILVMPRRRRRSRYGQTLLAIGVTGETYAHGLVRMRIAERVEHQTEVEITCTPDEVPALVTWAIRHEGRTHETPLPLAEHTQAPWDARSYRWTLAAHEAYRAAEVAA